MISFGLFYIIIGILISSKLPWASKSDPFIVDLIVGVLLIITWPIQILKYGR